ncbi:MAG TPA: pitrilysin family protein [Tepidisphaeraceae bacterium]|nr:pitrilysin family protein [Tepidisphaeraceae bacterium]
MPDKYFQHSFANGMTLLAEQMPGMQSAAMTALIPAGSGTDPDGATGSATVLADLLLRGAGNRDNRALTEHLDTLGLQRSSSVGVYHTRLGCAAPADKVIASLDAYADILLRPTLPADGFEPARQLALQSLAGIDDEPRQKMFVKLREIYFPWPIGRNSLGSKQDLESMTHAGLVADHARRFVPEGAILAFAGKIEFDELTQQIGKLLGEWPGKPPAEMKTTPATQTYHFEPQQTEQTHIGIAWPTVDETHPDYYCARIAYDILGGGMSSRLFTEVREKRALCYSVSAGYASVRGIGCVMGYAGTSNERAQATLDCFLEEVFKLSAGVTPAELDRTKVGLKANTIMSSESSGSRAGAIAHDFFTRGRIRTIGEIKSGIDAVSIDRINSFLKDASRLQPTIVVLGPKELTRKA